MLVRDIMTTDPITVRPDSDYLAAIALMRAGNFRRLPVVDEQGQLVGIVTDYDLLAVQPPQPPRQQAIQRDGVLVHIAEVMNRKVITIPPDYPLEEAARLMLENRVGSLPVTDGGRLVGIITETDIFKTLIRVLGSGSRTIRLSVQVDNTPGQFAALAGRVAAAGGNILSLASHPADTPQRMNLTMRVESISLDALQAAVMAHPGAEIRHVWDQTGAAT